MKALIAAVAVEKTAASFDDLFDYVVPDYLAGAVRAGARVIVPFGRGNRMRAGVVFSVGERETEAKLKEIYSAADDGIFLSASDSSETIPAPHASTLGVPPTCHASASALSERCSMDCCECMRRPLPYPVPDAERCGCRPPWK